MAVADGLLARFRPEHGLTPTQMGAIADAAEAHGNGLVEVTARGNLQIRGLSEASAPLLRSDLERARIAVQPAPAVEFSPIAGQDPKAIADPNPLAARLRAVCTAALEKGPLSPKLSIVLVTGGQVLLDGLKADIRLVALGEAWGLELGGQPLGGLDESAVPQAVATILEMLQSAGPRARASDLIADEVAGRIGMLAPVEHMNLRPTTHMLGPLSLMDGAPGLRIGLAFGQVRAWQLNELARLMEEHGVALAHPAPERTLVLVGFGVAALRDLAPALASVGFWTRPDSSGARLTVCSGAERSAGGVIQAAELAQAFASADPELVDGSFHLHVSTCAKGCPHAGRPGIVLEGDRLTLYRDATAKQLATLDPNAIEAGIVSLARRIRNTRQSGETTLTVLGRLGHQ